MAELRHDRILEQLIGLPSDNKAIDVYRVFLLGHVIPLVFLAASLTLPWAPYPLPLTFVAQPECLHLLTL